MASKNGKAIETPADLRNVRLLRRIIDHPGLYWRRSPVPGRVVEPDSQELRDCRKSRDSVIIAARAIEE